MNFPDYRRICRPAASAGFAISGFGYRGLAQMEPCAQWIPRAPRACPIIASSSTRHAARLARRDGARLDDSTGPMAFSESEQSKNEAGGMVPLYAARVQDLGTDDFVVIKCGACGHTAEIPPSGLMRGLRLKQTDKVLDLERRMVCRLCLARGQAVVSIKWKATS
jgi:hypothetical protein